MAVCDVCNKELGASEGYLLTTREVVSTPGYWRKFFSGPMGSMMGNLGMSGDSGKAQYASMTASQINPWMICNECISLFNIDKNRARNYAIRWYESGGTFSPPGSGAAPLSSVDMGDGKRFIQGGSPEALRMAQKLQSAGTEKKDSGCYIATAAYGTPMAQEVKTLYDFRDLILFKSKAGTRFVALYYRFSPSLSMVIKRYNFLKMISRLLLKPVILYAKIQLKFKKGMT
jgi:hypothetical protein